MEGHFREILVLKQPIFQRFVNEMEGNQDGNDQRSRQTKQEVLKDCDEARMDQSYSQETWGAKQHLQRWQLPDGRTSRSERIRSLRQERTALNVRQPKQRVFGAHIFLRRNAYDASEVPTRKTVKTTKTVERTTPKLHEYVLESPQTRKPLIDIQ
jgi:hypothetical protein